MPDSLTSTFPASTAASVTNANAVQTRGWAEYLDDLLACASVRMPLPTHGTLVRVNGLVLEVAGGSPMAKAISRCAMA